MQSIKILILTATTLVAALFILPANAEEMPIIPSPPQLAAKAWILMDADTGKILVTHNADQRLPPASLTKMMTGYITAAELDNGTIKNSDLVNVSVKAWKMGGSRMFIREGTKVKVSDLLQGMIVQSGNDATVALAEHIAGSEDAFVDMMNQQAQRLGMENTHYMNATGLPNENHYSTAHDLAILARHLIQDYPDHYSTYDEKYFTYNNIRQPNRNMLLWRDPSVDGIKTGHTDAAGYCLVASAKRDDMRLISVVMGTASEEARAAESQKLLTYGFRYYETMHLYVAGNALKKVRVWEGAMDNVGLGLQSDAVVTIPRGARDNLKASMSVDGVVKAPVKDGQKLGELKVTMAGKEIYAASLQAVNSVEEAGFFSRTWDAIMLFFMQLFGSDVTSAS